MRGAFTVSIHGGETAPTEPAVAPLPEDAPWWAWSERRAEQAGVAASVPAVAAWWTERAAPVREEVTPEVTVPEERELPPGKVVQEREGQAQQPSGTEPRETEPEQTEEASGTPWWQAAASEEADEEEEAAEGDDEE